MNDFQDSQLYLLWQLYFHKIVAIILGLQGLLVMFQSMSFIFIKMPQLEQQLALNQITPLEVNHLTNRAIITSISTVLSLFFALKITIIQSKSAKRINTAIAILLIIGNTQVNNFLEKIGSTELITTWILNLIHSIF